METETHQYNTDALLPTKQIKSWMVRVLLDWKEEKQKQRQLFSLNVRDWSRRDFPQIDWIIANCGDSCSPALPVYKSPLQGGTVCLRDGCVRTSRDWNKSHVPQCEWERFHDTILSSCCQSVLFVLIFCESREFSRGRKIGWKNSERGSVLLPWQREECECHKSSYIYFLCLVALHGALSVPQSSGLHE